MALAKHPEVLRAAFHRMDQLFTTVVPDQYYEFQQSPVRIKAEAKEPAWVLIIQRD
ncbi:hypothetical protein ACIQTZ_08870 [Paenarthrobacter sp. NPDC090520]|uniref:hypothetical protein n=1 Tax=unclassified Paenarthrobacter TaxID=2634190 RepID=UPI00382D0146